MTRQRLTPTARRQEILEAALQCFLERGFQGTTMEAVIAQTSLSKGGVYRYYTSTTQMLHDLMRAGTDLRFALMGEAFKQQPNPQDTTDRLDFLVDAIYKKMLDSNKYKKLYAIFLVESATNPTLATLRKTLGQEFYTTLQEHPEMRLGYPLEIFNSPTLAAFIDAILVGVELLNMREAFESDPAFLKNALRQHLSQYFPS